MLLTQHRRFRVSFQPGQAAQFTQGDCELVAAVGFRFYGMKRSKGALFGICVDCDPNNLAFKDVDAFDPTDNGQNPPVRRLVPPFQEYFCVGLILSIVFSECAIFSELHISCRARCYSPQPARFPWLTPWQLTTNPRPL